MRETETVEFRETGVPVDGLGDSIENVLDLFGAEVESSRDGEVRFSLPRRRGVSASGRVECSIEWTVADAPSTTVTLRAGKEIAAPKFQQIAILGIGSIGAILGLLWPFFPSMAAVSAVGFVLAFATYLLTLRTVPGGVAAEILQRVARSQRERDAAMIQGSADGTPIGRNDEGGGVGKVS